MDESEAVVGLYQRHAAAFDRLRGRNLFERPWLDRFADLLPQGASILDIGCGSAEPMAAHLIGRGFRLTGLDTSDPLIALCRVRFPAHDWFVGDMRSLRLGRQFDGLLAWHSFFHLTPNAQRSMFSGFAAHATPGAALMFTSGPQAATAIGSFEGEPLYHASLDLEEYRQHLSENGFEILQHVTEDPDCGGATVWLARKL